MTQPEPNAKAVATAYLQQVVVIREFMETVLTPALSARTAGNAKRETLFGLFVRASGWFTSLKALNGPAHFQAVNSATRALLEICIDMLLLYRDPAMTPERMLAWEDSSALDAAERMRRWYDENPPAPCRREVAFHRSERRLDSE